MPACCPVRAERSTRRHTRALPPRSLIFMSELGDKTFFIAALLAMRCGKWVSFIGSTAALAAMTVSSRAALQHDAPQEATPGWTPTPARMCMRGGRGARGGRLCPDASRLGRRPPCPASCCRQVISVAIGYAVKRVPTVVESSEALGQWAGAALLIYFGLRTLRDAWGKTEEAADDELADAEAEGERSQRRFLPVWGKEAGRRVRGHGFRDGTAGTTDTGSGACRLGLHRRCMAKAAPACRLCWYPSCSHGSGFGFPRRSPAQICAVPACG